MISPAPRAARKYLCAAGSEKSKRAAAAWSSGVGLRREDATASDARSGAGVKGRCVRAPSANGQPAGSQRGAKSGAHCDGTSRLGLRNRPIRWPRCRAHTDASIGWWLPASQPLPCETNQPANHSSYG